MNGRGYQEDFWVAMQITSRIVVLPLPEFVMLMAMIIPTSAQSEPKAIFSIAGCTITDEFELIRVDQVWNCKKGTRNLGLSGSERVFAIPIRANCI